MNHLLNWAEQYFIHKDVLSKNILSIAPEEDSLIITNKDNSTMYAFCLKELPSKPPAPDNAKKVYMIVTHDLTNLQILTKHWDAYVTPSNLVLIFVDLPRNKRWLLAPYFHAKIAHGAIPESLKALYNNCS